MVMQWIYRLLLAFNETSLILVVFFIKEQYYFCFLDKFPIWVSYIVWILLPVVTTGTSLILKRFLRDDSIEKQPLDIRRANNSFLSSSLLYFAVAFPISTTELLWFAYFILFVFSFFSQAIYFNPIYLIFGYKFYYVTPTDNVKILLVSKKKIKTTKELPKLKKINDLTFIDV